MNAKLHALGLSLALFLGGNTVHAATVPYEFSVSVDSGPRNGALFGGGFSYDDAGLSGVGEEYLALDSFTFAFEGDPLTLADDPAAEAVFYDGALLGVSYNLATPDYSVSFIPGFFSLDEAFFSYDLPGQGSGFGSLAVTAVPVPAAAPLLMSGVAALGLSGRRRRRNR